MNMGVYYHTLPSPDDMFHVGGSADSYESVKKIAKETADWTGNNIDFFVIIGVSDSEIRELYDKASQRADEISNKIEKYSPENKIPFIIELKRLYRFDKVSSAQRFLFYLASFLEIDDEEFYEDFMRDRIDWFLYEEPWVFARELTDKDWERGGLFYEEIINDQYRLRISNFPEFEDDNID